jgi:hypothetical protein
MKIFAAFLICLMCAGPALADGLDTFLDNLSVEASADRYGATASIGSHFGVPMGDVELIAGTTGSLTDAFMILQLGRMSGLPRTRVMQAYQSGRGRGWGALAQDLGIKPGSAEFHALKRGEFDFVMPQSKKGGGKGPGHGNHGGGKGKKK